jgi:hypothetical protein
MAEREVHVRPSLAAAFVGLSGCALACSAFDVEPPLADAGSDGACELAKVPPRSSVVSTVLSERDFVFAVRRTDMGEVDEGASTRRFLAMGYDLDQTCTGLGGGPSCAEPSSATADHTDGPGGRDNAFGMALYDATMAGSGSATESLNSEIDNGRTTIVIRVRGYNEGPNDGQVEVAVYGATMSPDADQFLTNPPNWSGEDVWHPHALWLSTDAESDAGAQENPPAYVDANAYVNDWQLVAKLDKFFLTLGMSMSEVFLTARIVPDGRPRYLLSDGSFAGRVKMDDVLGVIPLSGVCRHSPEYEQHKQRYCSYADISFSVPDDPSKPCDAVSFAWSFEAAPALLGSVNRASGEFPCADSPLEPADHCPE